MTQQRNRGSGGEGQSAMVDKTMTNTQKNPLPTGVSNPEMTPSELSVFEENQLLRYKIKKIEKNNKKAVRKFNEEQELKPYQAELIQLQKCMERRGKKMIIIFEGRGGAGKGGTIRRITRYMNAKHYRVVALGKPTAEERSQWFYQKYVREFPRAGDMVLFDRSWYIRALIEPVFGFCTEKEYGEFMDGVGGFEMDLTNQNIILVKLYFSVSGQERTRRFEQRRDDPLQRWKLNEIDLEAEERREEFTEAKYKMLRHTHTMYAPWTIIRSDSKHLARMNAMKVILNAVGYEHLNSELDLTPNPSIALSGAYELERMEAQRLRQGKKLEPLDAFCGNSVTLTRREGDI